jgi:hypothetical protein
MSGPLNPMPTGPLPSKGRDTSPAKSKDKKGPTGPSLTPADLVPVWMDVATAKFLVRTLTAALNQNIQPKKKSGKK